ncbi:MAG: hypothetical protein U0836_20645 [Pirellulales bacterium]
MPSRESYTPPTLAIKWACKPETVLAHIKAGRLRAFNLATSTSSRPRWRISREAVEAFEAQRSATPVAQVPRTRRRKATNTIEFF